MWHCILQHSITTNLPCSTWYEVLTWIWFLHLIYCFLLHYDLIAYKSQRRAILWLRRKKTVWLAYQMDDKSVQLCRHSRQCRAWEVDIQKVWCYIRACKERCMYLTGAGLPRTSSTCGWTPSCHWATTSRANKSIPTTFFSSMLISSLFFLFRWVKVNERIQLGYVIRYLPSFMIL